MATMILIEGEPGTGKSTSIRNLNPKQTVVITPNCKQLPFKGGKAYSEANTNLKRTDDMKSCAALMKLISDNQKHVKTIIIEDFTHFFTARVVKDANKTGYQKWSDMAVDCFNTLVKTQDEMREDLFVIMIAHTACKEGKYFLQTPGMFLEEKIKIPSYFLFILHTIVTCTGIENEYQFLTQTDGVHEAKSPMGCFETYEPNDLKVILNKIVNYWKE